MNKQTIYTLLILFILWLALKKSMDIIIDFKFPVYIPPPTGFWKYFVDLRDIFTAFSMIFSVILLIILSGVTNYYIKTIIVMLLLNDVAYFLVDKRLIWNIIPENQNTRQIIDFFDIYLNSLTNLLFGLYAFYAIVTIFFK